MSVHSQDSDNEELGAIGGNKPISRQVSPFSRPSSVVLMESLLKQQREFMQQQQENMRQQQEQMQQQKRELIQSITDQSNITNSTLADISRSQTDLNARLERLERASPDLNPVELRTNPSDGNFAFHAVPSQVTAPLATRPSITSEVSEVISPFERASRVAEGPQLPRTDCLLSVPRKADKTSDTVTFSPVARSREPGSQRKFPTQLCIYPCNHNYHMYIKTQLL